jgi:hypothetical protein
LRGGAATFMIFGMRLLPLVVMIGVVGGSGGAGVADAAPHPGHPGHPAPPPRPPKAAKPGRKTAALLKALPPGWVLQGTAGALTLRRSDPVRVVGTRLANPPPSGAGGIAPAGPGASVTLELRFRAEPAWTATQRKDALAHNAIVTEQLRALAVRFKIDELPRGKGRPMPRTDDERARLAAYDTETRAIAFGR